MGYGVAMAKRSYRHMSAEETLDTGIVPTVPLSCHGPRPVGAGCATDTTRSRESPEPAPPEPRGGGLPHQPYGLNLKFLGIPTTSMGTSDFTMLPLMEVSVKSGEGHAFVS